MNKKILPYELGKIALVLLVIGSIAAIALSAWRVVWFLIQLVISPAPTEFMLQIADAMPEKLAIFGKLIRYFFRGVTADVAKAEILRHVLRMGGAIAVLLLSRWLLRQLETAFKRRFMPVVLQDSFTEFTYDPPKRASVDEPLCALGLLHSIERYYTANRLEGLYRSCWVASEETVCGGVYLNHYTSHRVKVRGQWLTIRLDRAFDGTVILESVGTKNRYTHRSIARRMSQIEFDYPAFAERFRCYSDSPEQAQALINREMADKLLRILDAYPDLLVVFESGAVHFLVRRRSFDRRWEYLLPFCLPQLRRVANRLYGPLMDVTDELLK